MDFLIPFTIFYIVIVVFLSILLYIMWTNKLFLTLAMNKIYQEKDTDAILLGDESNAFKILLNINPSAQTLRYMYKIVVVLVHVYSL